MLFRQNENEDKGFQAAYVELSGAGHMRFVYKRDVFLQLRKAVAVFNGTHAGEETVNKLARHEPLAIFEKRGKHCFFFNSSAFHVSVSVSQGRRR